MTSPAPLPSAFDRYREMGGVLDFSVFEASDGSVQDCIEAIGQALRRSRSWPEPLALTFDDSALSSLGGRLIDRATFFGDWYDPESGALIRFGSGLTGDGRQRTNPRIAELEGQKIKSWASELPDPGAGGQFAYAFYSTPYGLAGRLGEVQAVFDEIRDFILPPEAAVEIRDWSSPRLPEVSNYFDAGIEWWGVFLFSLYNPSLRRLTIIAGSSTD